MRSWLPDDVGGVTWFNCDDANMVAYVPLYCCITQVPDPFRPENNPRNEFSFESAFWMNNWVANMVYPRYAMLFPSLKEVRDSLQQTYFQQQPEIESKARVMQPAEMQRFLNDYSVQLAQQMLARWKKLAFYLVVKYNDMVVKPEENGHFKRTENGLGATVKRPGFPTPYARQLIRQTGNRYVVPGEK
jgi:dipeptidase